jgi:hypothetical protein
MKQRRVLEVEVTKGNRVYKILFPTDAPLGECFDVFMELGIQMTEKMKNQIYTWNEAFHKDDVPQEPKKEAE